MIWKHNPNIETLNQFAENTLVSHLGIKITEVGNDYIKATMPVDKRTKQTMGLLHGGASAALSESIGSFAGVLIVDDPSKETIVGVELSTTHLKSVRSGMVTSITRPVKLGNRIQRWRTDIYDEQENHICVSQLTTMKVEIRD